MSAIESMKCFRVLGDLVGVVGEDQQLSRSGTSSKSIVGPEIVVKDCGSPSRGLKDCPCVPQSLIYRFALFYSASLSPL